MKNILCPLCSSEKKKIIGGSLYKCGHCGCAYNSDHRMLEYSDSYFTTDYKKQYGRTYEEDFENIYSISKKRIERIKKISGRGKTSILDIGSALGFFLKCASDSGYTRTLGIEISAFAAKFCKNKFKIETLKKPFNETFINEKFDVITSWYFIEHNSSPAEILSKIFSMLNNGGIFAMTVPSIFGPLFYFNREDWVRTHPVDHRVDFTPSSTVKILKKTGFSKIIIKPAGIHPERVLSRESFVFPFFERVYILISNILKFSDTIEVYAVK